MGFIFYYKQRWYNLSRQIPAVQQQQNNPFICFHPKKSFLITGINWKETISKFSENKVVQDLKFEKVFLMQKIDVFTNLVILAKLRTIVYIKLSKIQWLCTIHYINILFNFCSYYQSHYNIIWYQF